MNELTPGNVHAFLKKYALRGGRLTRFRVLRPYADGSSAEIRLATRDTESGQRARLRLVFDAVEEFRFQRRPGGSNRRLGDVQVGFFGPLIYLNLDAFPEDGPPKVMDFRASDCFLAGRTVRWEVVEKSAG